MLVLFSLLAASIVLLAIKRNRLSLGQGFLLAGFSAMSLIAVRNIHLYGIVAPFVLAETLDGIKSLPFIERLERILEDVEGRFKNSAWTAISFIALSCLFIFSQR